MIIWWEDKALRSQSGVSGNRSPSPRRVVVTCLVSLGSRPEDRVGFHHTNTNNRAEFYRWPTDAEKTQRLKWSFSKLVVPVVPVQGSNSTIRL